MPVPAGSSPVPAPPGGPIYYDPVLSRVRLAVPGLPVWVDAVHVQRSADQVRWSTVRGGAAVPVVAGVARVDDYEFTAGVVNYFRVSARSVLNGNPWFESDAAGWNPSGGTFVRSTAQAHEGAASGLLTPDGVTAVVAVGTGTEPAAAGAEHRWRLWLRCAVARTVQVGVNWWASGPVFLSDSVTSVAVAANTWTLVDFTATAPALTAFVQGKVQMTGTPAAGHLLYVDEAYLTGPDEEVLYAGTITPVLDRVWLKSIARPFLNMPVTVRDYSEVTRPGRAGVFPVVGRSFPVSVTDVRGSRRWSLEVNTYDPDEARDLDLLLAGGDIVLVHGPTSGRLAAVPGGYVTVGDTREVTPPTVDLRMRVFELPCVEAAAPGPDVVGATATCQTVVNTYASCTAVLAAHPTVLSLMDLVGDPEDVLVP